MKKLLALFLIQFVFVSIYAQDIDSLISKADKLKGEEKYEEARLIYQDILKITPDDVEQLNNLAECFYNEQMPDSAELYLKKAANLKPDYTKTYSNLSDLYYYMSDNEAALKYIQKALVIEPANIDYIIKEGTIYLFNQQLDEAIDDFNTVLKKDNENSKANYLISYVYYSVSYADSALKYINRAIELEENADYYKLKAEIYYLQSRYTDALFEIDKAIKIDGNNTEYIIAKAEIYSNLGQYQDVMNLIRPYLKEYNSQFYYYAILGFYNQDQTDSAFIYIKDAHDKDPTNDLFYYLEGQIYYVNGDYNNAYLNFKAAAELNPEQSDYFYMTCNSKLMLNTDSTVIAMDNKFYDFSLYKLNNAIKLSKSKKSKYYYSNLLSKFNSDITSLSLDEYFMLYIGAALQSGYSGYNNSDSKIVNAFKSEEYKKCIQLSNNFLADHPTSIETYYYLSNSLYMLGRYEESLHYLTAYYGLINGILYSGTGGDAENAFIVTSPSDEYIVLNYYNLTFAGQKLVTEKKKYYDIFYYYDSNNSKSQIYFYIDLYFGKK